MTILLDPNVAYMVLVGGFVLAILAMLSPGTGLLEIGALLLLVGAGYSIANMNINGWAIGLLLLGVFPFVLALRRERRSRRWLYLGVSLAALVIGSVFMFTTPQGKPAVNPWLALGVSTVVVGFLWFAAHKSIEALERPARSLTDLIGMTGTARTEIMEEGSVYIDGENWSARSNVRIPSGTQVRVISRNGLILVVEPANMTPAQSQP
jgi:membrane-bound ClpP family serine protease